MTCLEPNQIFDFMQGVLPFDEKARLDEHLSSCESCRTVVAEALSSSERHSSVLSPVAANRATPLPPGSSIGRYTVLGLLGSGGMGSVYAAYDPSLDRRIALKVVRPERLLDQREPASAHLLREARSMARVVHPNVVTVHDASEWNDQVVLALQYVDGGTLRQWLAQTPRSWEEIIGVFIQAGRGLLAAHRAGVVHRDFKPDNVLVGKDGTARVTDFGLARAPEALPATGETGLGEDASARMSRGGALVGTPVYMAPEQLRGCRADAQSDQFSFCVALYEALHGVRPFSGMTVAALAEAISGQSWTEAPVETRVPSWIRRVVLRGLKPAQGERFASMEELLSALDRQAQPHRRRWAFVGSATLVLAAAILAAVGLQLRDRAALCTGGEPKLSRAWGGEKRGAVEQAFRKTEAPFAEDAWSKVSRNLDRYAQAWAEDFKHTCEATRLRGEQSEELMDLRMQCLDRRLGEFSALVEVFGAADRRTVEKSIEASGQLVPLSACSDYATLTAARRPPDLRTQERITQLQAKLATVNALRLSGQYAKALPLIREAADASKDLGFDPLRAELLYRLGELVDLAGDSRSAEPLLYEAAELADSEKLDALGAEIWTKLVFVSGYKLARFGDLDRLTRQARVDIRRLGGRPELEGKLLYTLSSAQMGQGQYTEAVTSATRGLELLTPSLGTNNAHIARAQINIGNAHGQLAEWDESIRALRKAQEILETVLGPRHPEVAMALLNLGLAEYGAGQFDSALEHQQAALQLATTVLGAEHPRTARAHLTLGMVLVALGRAQEAFEHETTSLQLRQKLLGSDHPDVADANRYLAEALLALGRPEQAQTHLLLAQTIRQKHGGESHPDAAGTLNLLGKAARMLGRPEQALQLHKEAMVLAQKLGRSAESERGNALMGTGEALLALKKASAAVPVLEQALAVREASRSWKLELATTRFALARALLQSGGDGAQARILLEKAAAEAPTLEGVHQALSSL